MINPYMQSHPFWGLHAPLSTLISAGLILMASVRIAYALLILGALFWVYELTVLVSISCRRYFSRRGRGLLSVFLASLMGSIFLMLIYFINPPLAMETTFLIILTPISCIACGIGERIKGMNIEDALGRALMEALVLGGFIIALALIREPWGFGSFSVPWGQQGITELVSIADFRFFPVQVVSFSTGGLLLLGYALALFRRFQNQHTGAGNREIEDPIKFNKIDESGRFDESKGSNTAGGSAGPSGEFTGPTGPAVSSKEEKQ
jgi:hypothetical protein